VGRRASAACVGRPDITQPSSLITSTPTGGSGASAGRYSHWPHPGGGASSSGISTTVAWLPPAGAGAGVGKTDGVVIAGVMTAIVAVATCCGSAATATLRGGSLVIVVVPPVTLGALDERHLVGTDASDLSTLADARGGTSTPPCKHKNEKVRFQPLETRASGGATTYLKVEKQRFLFLEGSADAAAAPVAAAAALPDASVARAGASAARCSSHGLPCGGCFRAHHGRLPLCRLCGSWRRGWGHPPLGGARHPPLSSSSSSDEFSGVAGGESSYCSCSRYSSLCCSRRSRRRIFPSFLRVARSCFRRCAARAAARARGVGGSDHAASNITLC
jgi:hypothetical protein